MLSGGGKGGEARQATHGSGHVRPNRQVVQQLSLFHLVLASCVYGCVRNAWAELSNKLPQSFDVEAVAAKEDADFLHDAESEFDRLFKAG